MVRDDLDSAVSVLRAEQDENTCRKDFSPAEAVGLAERLRELEAPAAKARKAQAPGRPQGQKVSSADSAGETRDKIAAAVGMGRTRLAQATEVVEAAESGDPVAVEAAEEMERTGKVEPAYQ